MDSYTILNCFSSYTLVSNTVSFHSDGKSRKDECKLKSNVIIY